MDVILLKDIEGFGSGGDIINVKPGFARNYLVPRGLALRASKRNMAVVEEKKHIKEAQENRIEKANKILSEKLTKTTITIEVQVGEEERIFGSVTSQDIQGSLEANGISIDRSTILMEEPIKSLGVYNIPVRITADIEADLKVYIIKA
jgi:large subunit ribosomal protein L9